MKTGKEERKERVDERKKIPADAGLVRVHDGGAEHGCDGCIDGGASTSEHLCSSLATPARIQSKHTTHWQLDTQKTIVALMRIVFLSLLRLE